MCRNVRFVLNIIRNNIQQLIGRVYMFRSATKISLSSNRIDFYQGDVALFILTRHRSIKVVG